MKQGSRSKAAVIAVDARMMRATGIGTYIRNVLPGVLARMTDARFRLIVRPDGQAEAMRLFGDRVERVVARAPIYSLREQFELLGSGPADLFWSPHYNIPVLHPARIVATVHDVAHLALPEMFGSLPKRAYARGMFAAVRRRAAGVLCVSRFTQRELERHAGIGAERTRVTPLGVEPSWLALDKRSHPRPRPRTRPYLLFVGNVKPSKNVHGLLRAYLPSALRSTHDLVIAGRMDGLITGYADLAGAREAGVCMTGHLDDGALRAHMLHAEALVFPSLYEGFGIPPLEAMACGVPVLAANAASIPEVCGDAAAYFNPHDPEDMRRVLERTVGDADALHRLRAKGASRVRAFSYDGCAAQTVEVLRECLDGAKGGRAAAATGSR